MKIKLEKLTKKYLPQVIIIGIILITFLVTFFCFVFINKAERREFLFPSADDESFVLEYRNLPKESVQGDVHLFIDDLLLGSGVERTKLIFAPGTKVLSCFQRDDNLYLNLSTDLLFLGGGVVPIRDGIGLLEKNIKINFPYIKNIELYIDGNFIF